MNDEIVLRTDLLGYGARRQGKVRDIHDLGEHLLLIATDRVSAFDVVLPNGIPGKGRILTQISRFWFQKMEDIIPNHRAETAETGAFMYTLYDEHPELQGRTMLVKKAVPLPVECIVRGYLSGSGWKEYKTKGTVCDIGLPVGLVESARLDEPIFTPSTKAEEGHDINISYARMIEILCNFYVKSLEDPDAALHAAEKTGAELKEKSLAVYKRGSALAEEKGIIIADTKMEFGKYDGKLILIDELLTPDSSRFWSMETYEPGKAQDSYDKQIVRDYLLSIGWKGQTTPGPVLPNEIVAKTAARYQEIYQILTTE